MMTTEPHYPRSVTGGGAVRSGAVEGVHVSPVIPAPLFCRSEAALTEHFGVEKPVEGNGRHGSLSVCPDLQMDSGKGEACCRLWTQGFTVSVWPTSCNKCTACLLIMEEAAHVWVSVPASFVPARHQLKSSERRDPRLRKCLRKIWP